MLHYAELLELYYCATQIWGMRNYHNGKLEITYFIEKFSMSDWGKM